MKKISHMSHGAADPGRAKAVEFHPGMKRQQTDMAGVGGMGHPTVDGGMPAAPLSSAYSGVADGSGARACPCIQATHGAR